MAKKKFRKSQEAEDLANAASDTADAQHLAVYLYYFINRGGDTESRMYYYLDRSLPQQDFNSVMASLVVNAMNGDSDPSCHGTYVTDLIRRRYSYVVIALESDDSKMGSTKAAKIYNKFGQKKEATHTFKNPKYGELELILNGSKRIISWVAYENHMIDYATDKPLKNKSEKFTLSCTCRSATGRSMKILDEESGGTNMGPPVGPPYRFGVIAEAA
jgi:hypothetical protein